MQNDITLFVGLDVHKDSITVAYALGNGEVEVLGKIGTSARDIDRLCKQLQSKARHVKIVYEAGPLGYDLQRRLAAKGFECMVCAPSLIPRRAGDRVKTDRRDAVKLVRSLRAGDLSAVHVPTVEDEAFRDLARVWAGARDALKRARQALKSFLLAHAVRYAGTANWGPAHRRWISSFSFGNAWQEFAFSELRRDRRPFCAVRAARVGHARSGAAVALLSRRARPANHARHPVHHRRWLALGDSRCDAFCPSSAVDGLARRHAFRILIGGQPAPGQHHQDRQFACAKVADRGRLGLSASGQNKSRDSAAS